MSTDPKPPPAASLLRDIAALVFDALGVGLVTGGLIAKFGWAIGIIWLGAVALAFGILLGLVPDKSL